MISSLTPKIKDKETLLLLLRKDKEEMSPEFRDHRYPVSLVGIPFWSGSHGEVVLVAREKAEAERRRNALYLPSLCH